MWFPHVNWRSAKTICFSVKHFWPCVWSLCFLTFAIKAEWKLFSSSYIPTIKKRKTFIFDIYIWRSSSISLCKFAKCKNHLFFRWKKLALCMELMFFDFCYKSRRKIIASEGHWRLPSSPIVKRNMCCPYVNWQSAKFRKKIANVYGAYFLTFATKAKGKWGHLRDTGGSRRRQWWKETCAVLM